MKHFGSPSGLKCIANEPHSFSRLKVFFIRGKIFKKYCSFQRPSDVLWKMCLTLWKFLSATSCSFQCNAASNPSSCIEHGRRKFFSAGSNSGYSSGAKSGEISMYPLATKKTSVFAKNLMRKCQILKSREARSSAPLPTLMLSNELRRKPIFASTEWRGKHRNRYFCPSWIRYLSSVASSNILVLLIPPGAASYTVLFTGGDDVTRKIKPERERRIEGLSSLHVIVDDLRPGVNYTFRVTAVGVDGLESEPSVPVQQQTCALLCLWVQRHCLVLFWIFLSESRPHTVPNEYGLLQMTQDCSASLCEAWGHVGRICINIWCSLLLQIHFR